MEVNVFNSNYKDSTFVLQKNPLGVVHGLLFCHRPPSYHRYIKLTDFCSHGICGGLLGCSREANPCQINLRLKRCNQTLQLGTLWCSPLHLVSFLTYCFCAKSSGDWAQFCFLLKVKGSSEQAEEWFFKIYNARGIPSQINLLHILINGVNFWSGFRAV